MTFAMSPREFFEAALVAVGPPTLKPNQSSEEIFRDPILPEYVALRHAVLGIRSLNIGSYDEGAGHYSYGSYRQWWRRKQEDLCDPMTFP